MEAGVEVLGDLPVFAGEFDDVDVGGAEVDLVVFCALFCDAGVDLFGVLGFAGARIEVADDAGDLGGAGADAQASFG